MNLLDAAIIISALLLADRGRRVGFLRQLGSLGGFAVGLLIGAIVAPPVSSLLSPGFWRVAVLLVVFFSVAMMFGGLGQLAGIWVSREVHERRFGSIDRIFGSLFGLAAALTAAWLLASTFARTAGPFMTAEIQTSAILRGLDQRLPPAPDILTRVENSLGAAGLPRVFVGLEPTPAAPVTGPNADAVNAAAAAAGPSLVRLESLGCGGVVEGSGFVVANETIVTNAHVVAGVKKPVVQNADGAYRATVVYFNPRLDIAVLTAPGLMAPALKLATANHHRGTVGAVLGYPGGGRLNATPAAILNIQTAIGRDIYGTSLVTREVYELQTVVRPGNSGGPLVSPDGTVMGLIFAMSATNDAVGYALTATQVASQLASANLTKAVSTGVCLAE